MQEKASFMRFLNMTVIVSSLGYFVDIYDLILFSIVRIPSLQAIGVTGEELMSKGTLLLNMQMAGMLVGGILWGVLGDRKGRVSVLYGSILLYSLANLANAFVTTFPMYAGLRFLAGLGLAGELGAAVTLVSESLAAEDRGYGVALVASVGILGAIFAAFISDTFSWQTAYIVGGVMGLTLLAFRFKMQDSRLFSAVHKEESIVKGNFFMLLSGDRLKRYLSCIFVGSPNWFTIGVLVAFAPEITSHLSCTGTVLASKAIACLYLGLSLGDLLSGFLSQWMKSRKKVILLFLSLNIPVIFVYLTTTHASPDFYYVLFFILGIPNGYWAVVNTVAAEHFGTNLRATAATTVPNFIRAMVIPLSLGVQFLKPYLGLIEAISLVAMLSVGLAYMALSKLEETYYKNLDFVESDS